MVGVGEKGKKGKKGEYYIITSLEYSKLGAEVHGTTSASREYEYVMMKREMGNETGRYLDRRGVAFSSSLVSSSASAS